MKRILSFGSCFSLILVLILSGCSSSSTSSSNEEDVTTLSMWNASPELQGFYVEFIEEFEKEHPEIQIELELVPDQNQFTAAISDDNLPDIFTQPSSGQSLKQLVDLDQLHDLSDLFPEEVRDEYHTGTWVENYTTLDGKIYNFPLYAPNHATYIMYYNEDVLEENGISAEEIPETWEEFKEVGQRIYQESDGNVYGIVDSLGQSSWSPSQVMEQLATAVSPTEHGEPMYTTGEFDFATEGIKESILFYKDLYDLNVMDPESLQNSESQMVALFSAGRAAFMFSGNWQGSNLINGVDDSSSFENWGVAPLPTKDGEPYYNATTPNIGLEVAQYTDHWQEVEVFLQYFIDNGYSEIVVRSGATMPAKAIDIDEADVPFPQYLDILEIMNEKSFAAPIPYNRNLDTIQFMRDYQSSGANLEEYGDIALGLITGQVQDLEAVLQEQSRLANQTFDETLENQSEVERSDFIFPNWEPFVDYTDEDYEDLED